MAPLFPFCTVLTVVLEILLFVSKFLIELVLFGITDFKVLVDFMEFIILETAELVIIFASVSSFDSS
jgi:hypothetical protein